MNNIATNPYYNIWVSANAGAGKTHILSERVIRLLTAKIEPSKILCLTYTNAAASEMKARVFRRLQSWTSLTDAELKAELAPLGSDSDLAYARQLFAKVQDTPGGLKIQTIHAFCQLLLHNFCLEAQTPRNFTLIDEDKNEELQQQALLALFEDKFIEDDLASLLGLIKISAFHKLFKDISFYSNKFEDYKLDKTYLKNFLVSEDLVNLNILIYKLATVYLSYFNNLKNLYGYITYDDLIYRTKKLLSKENFSSWVHYKLDQGIDHVLLDEAQDTNPLQWDIIQCLISEFFAGEGQKDYDRSIFAVGDEKQAIYAFQGSQAIDFSKNGAIIKQKSLAARQRYKEIALEYSFRSSPIILSAIDKIFSKEEYYKGLTSRSLPTQHKAVRSEEDSYVEFWHEIIDEAQISASRKLAIAMAVRIEELIKFENAEPRDILVLVERRKDSFCQELLIELKNKNIAVAGLDKFNLYDHIAIRDLCALGRFVLHQYDDLALANIFKSPILGLSEEDLYNIAVDREATLWEALQQSSDSKFQPIIELLKKYCALAHLTPFEFYSMILSQDGGRKKFLARLGTEAGDVLDEFLNLCLNPKFTNLYSFLANIEEGGIEIKRELLNVNEVRIMTVHGAKGLEAPIVFIACRSWRHNNKFPGFIDIEGQLPIFLPNSKYKSEALLAILTEQSQKNAEEKKRLLYVAMTRAKDKLFICAYNKIASTNIYDWHNMVKLGLALDVSYKWHSITRSYYGNKPQLKPKVKHEEACIAIKLPKILQYKAKSTIKSTNILRPTARSSSIDNYSDFSDNRRIWGILQHKLLQELPELPIKDRKNYAITLAQAHGKNLSKLRQMEAIDRVLAFLENPQFKYLFDANGRAEVAIAGEIFINNKNYKVSGQLDRLIELPDKIIFCDYKTGRSAKSIKQITKEHLFQMALYYKLICGYNKGKKAIIALLIYSMDLKCFNLNADILENSLEQYIREEQL